MSVHCRPLVIRIVHLESGQISSEHEIPADMTGPEIRQWVQWLDKVSGPDYSIECPGGEL